MFKMKKGDIVDIVAPAGFSEPEVLIKAVTELTKWGLVTRSKIDFSAFHPFHSDDDDIRIRDFMEAVNNKDSKVIWCLRGGYGSARLLTALKSMKKPKTKKILIGYSDITALHLFVNQHWGWESIHGPLISSFTNKDLDKNCIKETRDILFARMKKSKMELFPMNPSSEKLKKSIEGELVGGNLAVIQSLIGTEFQMNAKNKILFIEDVNERGYQVDRMLNHLQMVGAFKNVKAIIFGDFVGGAESSGESFVEFALMRFALDLKIPVYGTLEFGHGFMNRPLICKHRYKIYKDALIAK